MDPIGMTLRDFIKSRPDAFLWCLDPSFDEELARIGKKHHGGRWSKLVCERMQELLRKIAANLLSQHEEALAAIERGECACAECEREDATMWRVCLGRSATHWDILCETCAEFREELEATINEIGRM